MMTADTQLTDLELDETSGLLRAYVDGDHVALPLEDGEAFDDWLTGEKHRAARQERECSRAELIRRRCIDPDCACCAVALDVIE